MSKFSRYEQAVHESYMRNRSWRLGQTYFNVLYFDLWDPELADEIRGESLDPFYDDSKIPQFRAKVKEKWGES